MFEKEEKRKICEGCRTGNYFLCNSFPGVAKEHGQREVDYRRKKSRRLERERINRAQSQVYRRDEDGVE
jgi:hypothetical protein